MPKEAGTLTHTDLLILQRLSRVTISWTPRRTWLVDADGVFAEAETLHAALTELLIQSHEPREPAPIWTLPAPTKTKKVKRKRS